MNTNDVNHVIIGGDLNTDLSRNRSLHTSSLVSFADRENLKFVVNHENADVDYTYEGVPHGNHSLIDHFIVTDNLYDKIIRMNVVHSVDNFSDHSHIYVELLLPLIYDSCTPEDTQCRVKWCKATAGDIDNYKVALDDMLSNIVLPTDAISCDDFFCKDHQNDIEVFHDSIVRSCLNAAELTIPHSVTVNANLSRRQSIAGWSDSVRESRDTAIFWHSIWKSCQSPRNGWVADIRRKTRARYHYAVKRAKQQENACKANKLANSFLARDKRDFWTNVRYARGKKTCNPSVIDGINGNESIGDLFAQKYASLYNSVSYDSNSMKNLLSSLDQNIRAECICGKCYNSHGISVERVKEAVNNLKRGKHDGDLYHYSDHLINGTKYLHGLMSLLFSCMLRHGFCPSSFLLSTVIPIPKNQRKSLNDSENYRGIALSSIMGKVLDWIILLDNHDVLASSNLQFGFKSKSSTIQCSFVAVEVINYYVNGSSTVNAVLLDASKAFDRVNYVKLFKLLIDKGLCSTVARFLAFMYTNQCVRVKWKNYLSNTFNVSNGVKQGGVLSPILFSVYIDELLSALEQEKVGCYIGDSFFGALAYADDILLLSPSRTAMSRMLKLCEKYAKEYDIIFNAAKSKQVLFGNKGNAFAPVMLNDSPIPIGNSDKHLGCYFGVDMCKNQVENIKQDLFKRANAILSLFNYANSDVLYEIFKSQCLSLYGCQLLNFDMDIMKELSVIWRKCVRRIWRLSPLTHSSLLPEICNDIDIFTQICKRFLKFIYGCFASDNCKLNICANLAKNGSGSAACMSLNVACAKFGISKHALSFTNLSEIYSHVYNCLEESLDFDKVKHKANFIRELIDIRDKKADLNITKVELQCIIYHLCVIEQCDPSLLYTCSYSVYIY